MNSSDAFKRSAHSQNRPKSPAPVRAPPALPTAQRAPAARLPHTPAARATAHCCARRTPRQCSRLPSPHAHAHRSQACRASPCTGQGCSYTCFLSDPVKVRPATDPACHCLPPPGPPHISSVRCRPATRWPAQPLVTHALFRSPRPRPARTPCPYVPLHPKGLASTGSRTCTACALPTRPLSYPSSLLP